MNNEALLLQLAAYCPRSNASRRLGIMLLCHLCRLLKREE